MKEKKLTFAELRQISLCVGWTIALADKSPEGKHRAAVADEAMKAFERVYGQGFHGLFMEKALLETN